MAQSACRSLSQQRQPQIVLPERYQVLRHLADGGMASVWCAWDSLLHRKVAIKVMSGPYLEDLSAQRRFSREARAGARLSSHPHIVTIYDVGVGESPFIVMEHLIGGTVGDALRLGRVPAERAPVWIRQAAAGLDYAHRHGVIHCDVKPGNLLLDGEHVVHVSDFGLALILSEEEASAPERFGTAAYLSPEQAAGAPATPASDRYALGVVAFELLTGQRPFAAEAASAVIRHHRETAAPAASSRNPKLPRALDEVFARALAKQESERWPTAMEFAGAIERALVERRVARWRRRPVSRRPVKRRRAAAIASAALAVSLAGIGIGIGEGAGPAPVARSQHRAKVAARAPQTRQASTAQHRHGHRDRGQAHAPKSVPQLLIPIYEGTIHPPRHARPRPAARRHPRSLPRRPAPPRAPPPPASHRHPRGRPLSGAGSARANPAPAAA
jgi:hypothetical protein